MIIENSEHVDPKGENFIDKPLSVIRCTVCFVKNPNEILQEDRTRTNG